MKQEVVTQHSKTHSCGAHLHGILWRAQVFGFTELREIQREQVHFVGIKFPNLLTVESLTRCVSYILPNYSLMLHCHGLLGYQMQLFSHVSPLKLMEQIAENWERP